MSKKIKKKSRSKSSRPWANELKAAMAAADGASRILLRHFGKLSHVSEKFQAGLVSEADRESENFIMDLLKSKFPEHLFLGEETGLSASHSDETKVVTSLKKTSPFKGHAPHSYPVWIIDPLDGTTNYVHQFPVFCSSIALQADGEVVVGVVDAPKLKMRFHAVKGQGAFLNGKPIQVSQRKEWSQGLFATGFSSQDYTLDEQLELVSTIIKRARGLRRVGAAAMDLCFVAQGVFDVFWEKHLKPWDTAAGSLIAAEAGAKVTNLNGVDYDPSMPHIVAGNPNLHSLLIDAYARIQASVLY